MDSPASHTVVFKTFGCKLNQSETAMMVQEFLDHGYRIAGDSEKADVAVINTCTVTGRSDAKCRQAIRQALVQNPEATLLVTGCYSQVAASEIASLPGVDYVLGVSDKLALFDHFPGPGKRQVPLILVNDVAAQREEAVRPAGDFQDHTRAFLKIQSGCDRRCSYCIVPIARGPSRSLPMDAVLSQASELIRQDFREIVLTGVHVGDFGKDRSARSELPELLRNLVRIDPAVRWRMSSLDPDDIDEELIHTLAGHPSICRHFHVALQSGSDAILRAMNRRHTTGEFRQKVHKIRGILGPVGLGTDIIVGFPGESDALFEETVRFVESLPFSYFHVFPFSPRKGTVAATLSDQIPPKIRTERARVLRAVGVEKKKAFLESFVGKTAEVLFENREQNGRMGGFTSEYARVEIPHDSAFVNRILPAQILKAKQSVLIGKCENNW
jgi:threonylcarbamoyladenosine tRNA methylthiotransferase MtaB